MVSRDLRRLAVALAVAAIAAHGGSSARAKAPGGRKVVLVGLDAADWQAIDPLVTRGELPAFARLNAAGRTADDHGVLDFMVDLPGGGQRPVGVHERRVPALWNLFSAAGDTVAVVGWW